MDFSEVVSCVHYANISNFITWFDDWLLLRFFNVVCSCDVRLL